MRCSAASIVGSAAPKAEALNSTKIAPIRSMNDPIVPLSASFRHNCNLHVACHSYDLLHDRLAELLPPWPRDGPAHENLSNVLSAREFRDRQGNIVTIEYVGLDSQVAGEIHMAVVQFRRTPARAKRALPGNRPADNPRPACRGGSGLPRKACPSGRSGCVPPASARVQLVFHFVRRMPHRELTQRRQIPLGEEVVQRPLRLLGRVDHAAFDPVAQRARA